MSDYRDKLASWDPEAMEKAAAGGPLIAAAGAPLLSTGGMAAWGAGEIFGGIGKPQAETTGYLVNRWFHPGLRGVLTRTKADEEIAKKMVGGLAERALDAMGDAFGSAQRTLKEKMVDSPMRHAILNQLKKEDDIISMADNKATLEAYHTMKNVAPTLSTDKNAVKSFLREAVQHQGGVDYMTLKGLADAEAAVTGRAYKGGGN